MKPPSRENECKQCSQQRFEQHNDGNFQRQFCDRASDRKKVRQRVQLLEHHHRRDKENRHNREAAEQQPPPPNHNVLLSDLACGTARSVFFASVTDGSYEFSDFLAAIKDEREKNRCERGENLP
jgi:hypothetical protein